MFKERKNCSGFNGGDVCIYQSKRAASGGDAVAGVTMSKYIISIWNVNKDGVTQFIEQANNHHPTIKFTAEISETEITFLPFVAQYRPTMPNLKQILMQKWHLIQQQPRLNS